MHCLTFSVVLFLLLISIPSYLRYLSHHKCSHRQGMIGYRQIRDDPNHTHYVQNTFEDVNPTLVYGGLQY